MQIQVNGEQREIADEISLTQLITELNLPQERIAIEVNQAVVRRRDWTKTTLQDGDRVEIVHFVGGGEANHRDTETRSKHREI